jgi:hypothetical protein
MWASLVTDCARLAGLETLLSMHWKRELSIID